jgi:hypothetical protein
VFWFIPRVFRDLPSIERHQLIPVVELREEHTHHRVCVMDGERE